VARARTYACAAVAGPGDQTGDGSSPVALADDRSDGALLVERARDGDADAWDVLYRESYPRLIAYARRRVADDAARDIVAETMARAVEGIDRYDADRGRFEAWLFGICRVLLLQAARKAGRPDRAPLADATSAVVGEGLDADEEARAMRVAYGRLTEDERELLDLRVIGALSADEVGVLLNRRPGAVRTAQSRALARLRIFFEEVYR
jgi:RNA polymerase sigma-70 factor (ECF subfamily)